MVLAGEQSIREVIPFPKTAKGTDLMCEAPAPVPEEEKEARSHELAEICRDTQQRYIARYLGRTLNVLVESKEKEGGLLSGYTENYIKALFTGGSHLIGTVAPVQLLEPTTDGARGEAMSSYQPEADIIPLTLVSAALAR